jgi:hypothetical protein
MEDRLILFNRASTLVNEYETDGTGNNLTEAMYDCLNGYIRLFNQEIEQLNKLNCIVDLCKSR